MELNMMQIKAIEIKLEQLAEQNESYDGSVFSNPHRAYCQGIAFTLDQMGYRIDWENGMPHIVKIGD